MLNIKKNQTNKTKKYKYINNNNNSNNTVTIPILILILIIYFLIRNEGFKTSFVKSKHNNKTYEIQDYNEDDQKIGDYIGKIEVFITKFVDYLVKKYPNDDRIQRLEKNSKDTVYKESIFDKDTSSYTINKGEEISICLRQKNKNKTIHDFNTLKFVIIHELGHVMTISEGHTEEWLSNFRFLLREAEKAGLYKPVNYSSNNINYCGVDVTHNPYYNSI